MKKKLKPNKEKLVNMLELMQKIRCFERKAKELYSQGLISGALHLYIGQEAVAVGACAAVEKDDYIG